MQVKAINNLKLIFWNLGSIVFEFLSDWWFLILINTCLYVGFFVGYFVL